MGKELLARYTGLGIPCREIENHNNIEEMRLKSNREFPAMKRALILGVRKSHRYVPNSKTSDFLVPYTSSGCTAMCLYCYLVCHFNKCSYLRLFVNREEMLSRLIQKASAAERDLVFEIGSNSDLVLENTITGNLCWTIERFAESPKGRLTLPTKFHAVSSLLPLRHEGKTTLRMSVNPQPLISRIELGTSDLQKRIEAVGRMCEAGYPCGLLIAPVMLVEGWKALYTELLEQLRAGLTEKVRKQMFLEIILMTYSYIHRAINGDAFPGAPDLYDSRLMTGRGRGKYCYIPTARAEAEAYLRQEIKRVLGDVHILYVS